MRDCYKHFPILDPVRNSGPDCIRRMDSVLKLLVRWPIGRGIVRVPCHSSGSGESLSDAMW